MKPARLEAICAIFRIMCSRLRARSKSAPKQQSELFVNITIDETS